MDDIIISELRRRSITTANFATRVVDQSSRRVLKGEQVPTKKKIYSIFEPHSDLIKRGKVQKPDGVRPQDLLAESARGLITDTAC